MLHRGGNGTGHGGHAIKKQSRFGESSRTDGRPDRRTRTSRHKHDPEGSALRIVGLLHGRGAVYQKAMREGRGAREHE